MCLGIPARVVVLADGHEHLAKVDVSAGLAVALAGAAVALARRFASGATMWCVAPEWPWHARHVAVEFAHPVAVGKRALPAVALEEADLAGTLRLLARPGDVLCVISSAGEARCGDLVRRAEAWGLTRVWLGAGPRPDAERPEAIVFAEGLDPATAARAGGIVQLYHVLWELTHVVLEHPGRLARVAGSPFGSCPTCRDDAQVAEVRRPGEAGEVEVLLGGRPETVDTSLVGPLAAGDLLLVHAGVALAALRSPEVGGLAAVGP